MPPHFMADIEPFRWVILLAFLDPVVIAIAVWMGWNADQKAKLVLAGFAAALAGVAVTFLVRLFGRHWFEGGYSFGGLHAFSRFFAGIAWAAAAYAARRLTGRGPASPT
jgi:hypothetical protein